MIPILKFFGTVSLVSSRGFSAEAGSSSSLDLSCNMSDKPAQDWDTDRYQDQHSFVWKLGSSLVDILDPQPNETILDVGCGTGELTFDISKRSGSRVFGMDADPSMIQQASNQYPDVTFRVADARSFALEENGKPVLVDAIFSNAALHWVPEAERAVASMAAALKPGGRIVVEFGGKGNVKEIADYLDKATHADKNPWYFPSIAEYSGLLEKHGIEVTFAQLFDRPTPLSEGEQGLRNWILMFGGPYLEGLEADEKESLLKGAETALRRTLHNKDHWIADYRRIRVVGRKIKANQT